jgi:magnesium transporter
MNSKMILKHVEDNMQAVIRQETPETKAIWHQFLSIHPADIAQFLTDIEREQAQELIVHLPKRLKVGVFTYLSDAMKIFMLSILDRHDKIMILNATGVDELTDLFDSLSNEELKDYLDLLNAHDRQQVISLLKFDPQSAGGIMDTDVVTLREDFTVEKSINILQRLKPRLDLHQQIYVTNHENKLVGHIGLEDLVLKSPNARLSSFMLKNELIANVDEDQEKIAKEMIHYQLMTVPVVGKNNFFLGVIPSDTLVNIIEQEASEDVYRISAMVPITKTYFETPFFRILYERSYILIILLLAQSLSTMIIRNYEATLEGFLILFITMLTSTGGNSSSQTSALVIQGMASGEIHQANIPRFLRRELGMAVMMAILLGLFSFARVYFTYGQLLGSIVVSVSLSLIVLVSVVLGSGIPIILKKLHFDPAFAAGPFLATIMDILGLFIYCYISSIFIK